MVWIYTLSLDTFHGCFKPRAASTTSQGDASKPRSERTLTARERPIIMATTTGGIKIFSGSSHPELANLIAKR